MKSILAFLRALQENNYKAWFDEHKADYLEANAEFLDIVERLIAGIGSYDPAVNDLTVKQCTYRIYRDIRFSPNKIPYKTHLGAFIAPNGKSAGYAGYYFHIEPVGHGYLNGHQLWAGLYAPQPVVLKSVREEILINGDAFHESIKQAEGFSVEDDQALKKVPRGYPADFKYADYLKLRNPGICRHVTEDFLLSPHFLDDTIEAYSKTVPFTSILNQAIAFALEQD